MTTIAPARTLSAAARTPAAQRRVDAVDLLRGLVMVLMMLDHVRDFTHASGFLYSPTDLARTTPMLFLTRWITHFCAPVFVFLAGTGAWLRGARGGRGELARFLATRGLWLVVLELVVVRGLIYFNYSPNFGAFLQVIWAIGVSMLVLALLVRLPARVVGAIGITIVVGHDLLDPIRVPFWFPGRGDPPGPLAALWIVVHQGGIFAPFGWPGPVVLAAYPLLPWIGVMCAGYAFGTVYDRSADARRRLLVRLGVALTVAFVVLRALDAYGDPAHWSAQRTWLFTVLSFLNTSKYPPSLLFLLMTLGPAILLLGALEGRAPGRVGRKLVTFGRVPFFFYVLQWLWAHVAAIALAAAAGHDVSLFFASPLDLYFLHPPKEFGFPLPVTWAAWAVGVVVLYLPCRWFATLRARRRDWWLSYL